MIANLIFGLCKEWVGIGLWVLLVENSVHYRGRVFVLFLSIYLKKKIIFWVTILYKISKVLI